MHHVPIFQFAIRTDIIRLRNSRFAILIRIFGLVCIVFETDPEIASENSQCFSAPVVADSILVSLKSNYNPKNRRS